MWGMRQGAKAYITKPFSEDELSEVLERVFSVKADPPLWQLPALVARALDLW